jgi:hypothetical protein
MVLESHRQSMPIPVCDPQRSFNRRYSWRRVPNGVMSQIRPRQFLTAAAEALDITIPQPLRLRADRVIE